MCGIAGGIWSHVDSPENRLVLSLDKLRQRGPDDSGYEFYSLDSSVVGLGHTRLSIVDLSDGGHQPMNSSDGRYAIVFNGEIYNYRELRIELQNLGRVFKSFSDTEVLLAAWTQWGKACLPRLTGMFAFAILDRESQILNCVRDAFGIKPFFYSERDGFCFASEIPAILELHNDRPAPNPQRAYDYLVSGDYDDQEDTFYKDIKHLLPGHLLTVDLKGNCATSISRWWYPVIVERRQITFEDAAAAVRKIFLNNVQLHLRSDVPLGAALSGGLDSSATVCAMRYLEPEMPIHTFTYVASGVPANEETWANKINDYVGAIPHKVFVTSEELAIDLDDMIRTQGEPFSSTSIYAQYRVFKQAKEQGIIVTLDGQGADELLAGYNGYPRSYLQSLKDKDCYIAILVFLYKWSQWPGRGLSQAFKLLVESFLPLGLKGMALKCIGRNPLPSWIKADAFKSQGVVFGCHEMKREADGRGRRLVEALRFAMTGHGLAALLRHGDRNSMRWSIESRVPFLTPELAEYLLSLPEEYLLSSHGETKHVFRAAMRGIVPDEILDRKDKVGFETPEREWLIKLKDHIDIWLTAASNIPFLDEEQCRQEIDDVLSGKKPFGWQAWRLINYCRWWQLQYM